MTTTEQAGPPSAKGHHPSAAAEGDSRNMPHEGQPVNARTSAREGPRQRSLSHDTALRERTEAMFAAAGLVFPMADEALPKLKHELLTHQLELEMQNDELCRIQAELAASRALYVDLYEQAPVGYFSLDVSGLILQANLTAASLLGRSLSGLINERMTRFIVPEDQDVFYLTLKSLVETGAALDCELRLTRADDRPFWGHLSATKAQDERGAAVLRLVLSDVSERKRTALQALRDSDDLKRSVIDSLQAHIAVLDGEGIIVAVNEAWRRYARDNGAPEAREYGLGLNYLSACAGRPDALGTVTGAEASAGIRAVLQGERAKFQLEYPCHSPTEQRWFMLVALPLQGSIPGAVVSHIDVSQRKLAE